MTSLLETTNEQNPLRLLSEAMADTVANAGKSVLTVDARRRISASGIAFSTTHVLTAAHVLERDEDIHIILPDNTRFEATLTGYDPGSDLALLGVEQGVLVTAKAAADNPRVGEFALSLGRPISEGIQASLGIISAYGGPIRTTRGVILEQYLRTDAIPYPGFSGGPLINAAGEIVGVNTSGLVRGLSISIPVAHAWSVAEMLLKHGRVRRGYLGVRSQPVDLPPKQQEALGRSQPTGLLVVSVEDDSPALRGGLFVGDILVGLAGQTLMDPHDLVYKLAEASAGQEALIEILRGGQLVRIPVIIGERN